ncbi:MAG: DUF763 domain-containing protein [Phycisphaerae bacterium]|nr:DUF763 domain-containing protein [Phycisphaerae bacterium]
MLRKSTANLPLHGGNAPPWLFQRMEKLAGSIIELIVLEFGSVEMLRRLADPHWFQAFGCVLGFDWHSSGLTTVTCGAIKQAYRRIGPDLGIHAAGGKGGVSRKTPHEIDQIADARAIANGRDLIYASKLSAKVDSAAVQDGYQLYHHSFFFDDAGRWTVVQQGMNDENRYARRYHWFADQPIDFVNEPHAGIITEAQGNNVLNMVASEADRSRQAAVDLFGYDPEKILAELPAEENLFMPRRHEVILTPSEHRQLRKVLIAARDAPVTSYQQLLATPDVGPKTVRSLALLSELIFDAPASHRDPARYSFAHGGKDGYPFPVERRMYDRNIALLEQTVQKCRINPNEKDHALRRLQGWLKLQ